MPAKIDLHTHTNLSDGALSPIELVQKASERGLDIISITDHDSVNGIKEATAYARELGIDVVTGLEISTDLDDKEMILIMRNYKSISVFSAMNGCIVQKGSCRN